MKHVSQIKIVIADDHAILRAGLRMLLNAEADMHVVGEAEDGEQTLEQLRSKKPDILLLDIGMPETSGIEVATEARRHSPKTRIVFLTMHEEPGYLRSALATGASGYVVKRSLDSQLVSAIRDAHQGKTPIDSAVAKHLLEKAFKRGDLPQSTARETFNLLSRRERLVLKLAAEGYTNSEIATKTFVGVKSIETYRARLLKKLQIKTRREMVTFAIEAGLFGSKLNK